MRLVWFLDGLEQCLCGSHSSGIKQIDLTIIDTKDISLGNKNSYVGESWLLTETVRGFSTGDAGWTNPAAIFGRAAGGTIGTAAPSNIEK